jgi:hypothetical protein
MYRFEFVTLSVNLRKSPFLHSPNKNSPDCSELSSWIVRRESLMPECIGQATVFSMLFQNSRRYSVSTPNSKRILRYDTSRRQDPY